MSRYETLYYQGRIDEMEKLAAQIEPVLEQFGAANQHVDYNTSRVMLVLRQKRFNLSSADLVFSVKAAEFAATVASEMKLAYMEFGLGFGYLWAGQRDQAGEHLRLSLAKAEAMAYLPLQDQCLAYLTIASRLAGDVAQARLYQARSAEVAQLVGTPYYLGVAEANQAWLHYLDKQWDLATASARKALERWQAFVYPFHWLAHWPILAINLARDDLAGAVDSAAAMLDPGQQRLPDDVNDALERAVQAWESGKPDTSRRALEQVLILARDRGYL